MDKENPYEIKECHCPICNHYIDAATLDNFKEGVTPEPGDLSICFYCASILTFNEDLGLDELPVEEFIELPLEQRSYLKKTQEVVVSIIRSRREQRSNNIQ